MPSTLTQILYEVKYADFPAVCISEFYGESTAMFVAHDFLDCLGDYKDWLEQIKITLDMSIEEKVVLDFEVYFRFPAGKTLGFTLRYLEKGTTATVQVVGIEDSPIPDLELDEGGNTKEKLVFVLIKAGLLSCQKLVNIALFENKDFYEQYGELRQRFAHVLESKR